MKVIRIMTLALSAVLLFAPGLPAAQEINDEDVPQEYLDEAFAFNAECQANPQFANFYDCPCLSARLLESRIKAGPIAPQASLIMGVDHLCKDGTGLAGRAFTDCLTRKTNIPDNTTPDAYCSCVANTLAKNYENMEVKMTSKAYSTLKARAIVACRP